MAVAEGFPSLAFIWIGEVAMVMGIILLVGRHIVPLGYGGANLGPHVLHEDIPVSK